MKVRLNQIAIVMSYLERYKWKRKRRAGICVCDGISELRALFSHVEHLGKNLGVFQR